MRNDEYQDVAQEEKNQFSPENELENSITSPDSNNLAANFDAEESASFPEVNDHKSKLASFRSRLPKQSSHLAILVAVTVILLGLLIYYFAIFIPNKPQNVFSTSLDRTGIGLDKIIEKTTNQKSLTKLKSSEITGTLDGEFEGGKINGALSTKYNDKKVDANLNITYSPEGAKDQKYSVAYLSEIADSSSLPNIFFRIEGFKNLDLDSLLPGITKFDGKWIVVEESYAKKITDQYKSVLSDLGGSPVGATQPDKAADSISAEDYSELAKVFSDVTKKYVFTDDQTKSVLINKQFVAKETIENRDTYHFLVGVNKDNFESYCNDLSAAIIDTSAYKKFVGITDQQSKDSKAAATKECQQIKNNINDTDTYDLWVDAKTKLLYKIRFSDQKVKDDYIEIGQKYDGGDEVQLFSNIVSKTRDINGTISLDFNFKTAVSKVNADFGSQGEDKWKLKFYGDTKPLNGEIKLDKPTDAVKLQDAARELGMDLDAIFSPQATNQNLNSLQSVPIDGANPNVSGDTELVAN